MLRKKKPESPKLYVLEITFKGGATVYIEVDDYTFDGKTFSYTYPAESKRKPIALATPEIVAIVELSD